MKRSSYDSRFRQIEEKIDRLEELQTEATVDRCAMEATWGKRISDLASRVDCLGDRVEELREAGY